MNKNIPITKKQVQDIPPGESISPKYPSRKRLRKLMRKTNTGNRKLTKGRKLTQQKKEFNLILGIPFHYMVIVETRPKYLEHVGKTKKPAKSYRKVRKIR